MTLTPRQREVLFTVARADSQQAAAAELGITYQTVKNTLDTIHRKLGVRSTVAALYRVLGEPWAA